jgi:precorrin-6B methylase 2
MTTPLSDADLDAALELARLADLARPIAIRAVAMLGVADAVAAEPRSVDAVASDLGVDPGALDRLMAAACPAGVFEHAGPGHYRLGPVGTVLREDHPLSMRHAFSLGPCEVAAWSGLHHCLRTGASAFAFVHGESHRSYRARHEAEDIRMDRAHQAATRLDALTLSRAYPWGASSHVVDVGGGTGMLAAALLRAFPHLTATVLDLPRMVARAGPVLEAAGVAERCHLVGGDFFDAVPAGADLYVLKAVVGGWDDESTRSILATVRVAMRDDSRLLLIEPISEGSAFATGNVVQLQSMVLYGGRDRTVAEYAELADAAGLQVCSVVRRSTLPILELSV